MNEKNDVCIQLSKNGMALKNVSKQFRNDKYVVTIAIINNRTKK